MEYSIDLPYLLDCFTRLAETPSPVGYYVRLNPLLAELAGELGLSVTHDHRNTTYITLEGQDNSRTVMLGAHGDTVGFAVRCADSNGMLQVRKLGGINMASTEGETVRVHTRDGKTYTGMAVCKSHSVHVFEDCHTMVRSEDTIRILLDEPVGSRADVKALGIQNGDAISVDPRVELTSNGYLKSRYIDDKGSMACIYAALKALRDQGLTPKWRTIIAFPYYEEIGMGGAYVPPEVEEFVSVDIGLIGPELDGHEKAVSICAKDAAAPYDFELTNRLIRHARRLGIDYAVDTFFHYSTDANVALRSGNDLRHGAFGVAVYCSHGRERTHVQGLEATARLVLGYLLDV